MKPSIESLEYQKAGLKQDIERQEMALRLAKNKDFKKLILEEFCVNECARYAQASGDRDLNAEQRADSLSIAQAAGHIRRWLSVVNQMGNVARSNLVNVEAELDDVRANGEDEDEE